MVKRAALGVCLFSLAGLWLGFIAESALAQGTVVGEPQQPVSQTNELTQQVPSVQTQVSDTRADELGFKFLEDEFEKLTTENMLLSARNELLLCERLISQFVVILESSPERYQVRFLGDDTDRSTERICRITISIPVENIGIEGERLRVIGVEKNHEDYKKFLPGEQIDVEPGDTFFFDANENIEDVLRGSVVLLVEGSRHKLPVPLVFNAGRATIPATILKDVIFLNWGDFKTPVLPIIIWLSLIIIVLWLVYLVFWLVRKILVGASADEYDADGQTESWEWINIGANEVNVPRTLAPEIKRAVSHLEHRKEEDALSLPAVRRAIENEKQNAEERARQLRSLKQDKVDLEERSRDQERQLREFREELGSAKKELQNFAVVHNELKGHLEDTKEDRRIAEAKAEKIRGEHERAIEILESVRHEREVLQVQNQKLHAESEEVRQRSDEALAEAKSAWSEFLNGLPEFLSQDQDYTDRFKEMRRQAPLEFKRFELALRVFHGAGNSASSEEITPVLVDIGDKLFGLLQAMDYSEANKAVEAVRWARALNGEITELKIFVPRTDEGYDNTTMVGEGGGRTVIAVHGWGVKDSQEYTVRKARVRTG